MSTEKRGIKQYVATGPHHFAIVCSPPGFIGLMCLRELIQIKRARSEGIVIYSHFNSLKYLSVITAFVLCPGSAEDYMASDSCVRFSSVVFLPPFKNILGTLSFDISLKKKGKNIFKYHNVFLINIKSTQTVLAKS